MRSMLALDEELRRSLQEKCRRNAWLNPSSGDDGGEDDHAPLTLEISTVSNASDAKRYLLEKHRAGEGILMGNMVFIQQVDFGDEWWVLRSRAKGGWDVVESASFAPMAKQGALDAHIASLINEECAAQDMSHVSEKSSLAERTALARKCYEFAVRDTQSEAMERIR